MLYNTSYNDKKINAEIDEKVGKAFGIFDNFKLKGIGSPKLDILKASKEITTLLSYDNNRNFCNIELRPNGIIIRFRSLLETFSLIIPFYKLVLYKPGNNHTFYIDHHYITVNTPPNNKGIRTFIDKIIQYKIDHTPTSVEDL
jgi:hypothetical protein